MPRQPQGFSLAIFAFILGICCPPAQSAAASGRAPAAFGQRSAAKVLDSWMHSPGHRTNILNSNFTEMGAGYAVDRTGRPYYVQVFARPLS